MISNSASTMNRLSTEVADWTWPEVVGRLTSHTGNGWNSRMLAMVYSPITSAKHRKVALTIDERRLGISTRNKVVNHPAPRLRDASTRVRESMERMPASRARNTNGSDSIMYRNTRIHGTFSDSRWSLMSEMLHPWKLAFIHPNESETPTTST